MNELLDKIYKKYTKFTNRLLFFFSVQGIIDVPVADKWRIARSPCVALGFFRRRLFDFLMKLNKELIKCTDFRW